jgi:DedD protein
MGLLSRFKFGAKKADKRSGTAADAAEVVRAARIKARRRLMGAALLLGVGIIGFPLLFETQPRPIPVDIAIDIPSREGAAPLLPRSGHVAQAVVAPPPVEPSPDDPQAREIIEPVVKPDPPQAKVEAKPDARTEAKLADKPAAKVVDKAVDKVPEKKPEPKPDVKPEAKPEPKVDPKTVAKVADSAAADSGRFVVQVGAFAEATSAREARLKVEAMGLKTYTQVIESSSGRRIRVRVGPFTSKADAEKASVRIKLGGLPAAVLTL